MLMSPRIVRDLANRVGSAVERTARSLESGQIAQEPDFTSRMVTRIEDAVQPMVGSRTTWEAHVLSDRGPRAAESQFGADFLGVLNVELDGFRVAKGFLAQAKLVRGSPILKKAEHRRMLKQCDAMLSVSPDSFVFIYSKKGVRVVPALAVRAMESRDLSKLYSRSPRSFFELHFECFIGDRALSAANEATLATARAAASARVAYMLRVTG